MVATENIRDIIMTYLRKYRVHIGYSFNIENFYLSQNNIRVNRIEYEIYHNYCVALVQLHDKYDDTE